MTEYIYFAQAGEGAIKIGCSTNVKRRLKEIQGMNPEPIRLLGITEGSKQRETHIHSLFVSERINHSEWFKPSKNLMAYITKLSYGKSTN